MNMAFADRIVAGFCWVLAGLCGFAVVVSALGGLFVHAALFALAAVTFVDMALTPEWFS